MATMTIRGLDEDVKAKLRIRAARHGNSMEAEVRAILREVLDEPEPAGLGSRLVARFAEVVGEELDLPPRTHEARVADVS
jgi:plasmid stability protein